MFGDNINEQSLHQRLRLKNKRRGETSLAEIISICRNLGETHTVATHTHTLITGLGPHTFRYNNLDMLVGQLKSNQQTLGYQIFVEVITTK